MLGMCRCDTHAQGRDNRGDNPVLLLLPEGVTQASSLLSSGHGFDGGPYTSAIDRLGLPLEL